MYKRQGGARKQLGLALENYNNDEVSKAVQALRSVKVENDAWYPQPDPSLDLMRCIVDVDGGAHWPVLLSKPGSSVFAEPVHYALSLLLEHCALPLTARDALALDAAALSKRVGSDEEAQLLRKQLMQGLSLIHISEPTRLGMISYAVFCLKKKK